jgi:murein tripeptide amidase MpaA
LIQIDLQPQTLIPDLQNEIEEQMTVRLTGRSGDNITDFFDNYHPLAEVYSFTDYLQKLNPEESTIDIMGQSYENRDLRVLKVGNSKTKPIVWIDGGTHAREWIGHMTVLFMANEVASAKLRCDAGLECPPPMKQLLDTYDFYFLPMLNPDGFEFTRSNDRLWRKTRSDSEVQPWAVFCKGTDPNRNYNAQWGGSGSSGNPCSQTYAGKTPHSEREVKSLTDYVSSMSSRVKLFVSLHSYSQIMLLPYGYSSDIPQEYPDLEKVAISGAAALKASRGTEYRIGSSARILYAASGTASDWAFLQGIKYSYTFELPDTGDKGFLLPPDQIRPVGLETWEAIKSMALAVSQV